MIFNLLRQFLSFSLANTLNRLTLPFISLLLAMYLSSNKYGAWSVYVSIIPLLVIFFDFGLSKTLSRYYFDYSNKNLEDKIKFLVLKNISLACLLTLNAS